MLKSVILEDVQSRLAGLTSNSIARGLALSLALHFILFCTVELGHRLGLWDSSIFKFLRLQTPASSEARKKAEAQNEEVVPIVFVEVDPSRATQEAPKDSKYYGARNSLAGNPDTQLDSNVPKISGTQDKVPKMTDTARSGPQPLQPAPAVARNREPDPQETPPKESLPEPKGGPKPGDLAMAKSADRFATVLKPALNDRPEAAAPPTRPRRLAQVRNEQSSLEGAKMKQEGGMKRFSIEGLDVKATPFGTYDQAIIEAIQKHWFDLLEDRNFARNDTGKVVLTFRLNSNGTVTVMRVAESTVAEILSIVCQRAVQEPAPFPPWPNDMRRLVGADYREVRFTFYYN